MPARIKNSNLVFWRKSLQHLIQASHVDVNLWQKQKSYSWNGENKITKPNYGYKLDLGLIIPIKKQQLKWKIKPRSFSVVGN